MKVVLANGCFDLLHAGHVAHLKEARAMGDRLIVALTADEHVNKGPGRPVWPWLVRCNALLELPCVDSVVISESAAEAILKVRPAIFVKGCDYSLCSLAEPDIHACAKVGAEIRFTTSGKRSTTEIIERMRA